MNDKSDIRLFSSNGNLPEYRINFDLQGEFNLGVKIFKDKPVQTLPVIDVLPIPVEIVTIYFYFSYLTNILILMIISVSVLWTYRR